MLPNLLMGANGGVDFDFVGMTQATSGTGGISCNISGTGCVDGDLIIIAAASWTAMPSLLTGFTNVLNKSVTLGQVRIQARVRQAGDANTGSIFGSSTRATVGVYAWRPKLAIKTTLSTSLASDGVVPLALGDGIFRGVFRWVYNSGSPVYPSDYSNFDYQHSVNNGNYAHITTGLSRFKIAAPAYTHGDGQGYYNIITQRA